MNYKDAIRDEDETEVEVYQAQWLKAEKTTPFIVKVIHEFHNRKENCTCGNCDYYKQIRHSLTNVEPDRFC